MKYSKLEQILLPLTYGLCIVSVLGLMLTSSFLIWSGGIIDESWVWLIRLAATFGILSFGSATLLGAIEFRGRTRQRNDDS